MIKFFKRLIKRISTFETITTKLLILVLFTTIIPLFAIANITIGILTSDYTKDLIKTSNAKTPLTTEYLIQKNTRIPKAKSILSISIISLFVAIFIAIIFSRTITTPILKLLHAANELAKGNFNYRLQTKGHDEIAELSLTFNKMAENLQKQQGLRDNFVATLTHDLKVPMLAENQAVDHILKEAYGPITVEQKEVLEIIKSTNNSSLEMVSTLLEIYRYDMGIAKLYKTDFDIIELLKQSTNEVNSLALEKNIDITVVSDQNEISINADEREIKRVFHNIISNAINNSIINKMIECTVEYISEPIIIKKESSDYENSSLDKDIKLQNSVLISIKDNGIGISKTDIKDIFKRFSLSKGRKPSGSGLGLFYSFQVLNNHKGKIWAQSTEGKGSVFNLTLPVV